MAMAGLALSGLTTALGTSLPLVLDEGGVLALDVRAPRPPLRVPLAPALLLLVRCGVAPSLRMGMAGRKVKQRWEGRSSRGGKEGGSSRSGREGQAEAGGRVKQRREGGSSKGGKEGRAKAGGRLRLRLRLWKATEGQGRPWKADEGR